MPLCVCWPDIYLWHELPQDSLPVACTVVVEGLFTSSDLRGNLTMQMISDTVHKVSTHCPAPLPRPPVAAELAGKHVGHGALLGAAAACSNSAGRSDTNARLGRTMLQQLLASHANCWLHCAPSGSSRLSEPTLPLARLHGGIRHSLPDLQSSTAGSSLYMDTALVLQADIPVVIGGQLAWLHLLSDVLWQDASYNSTMVETLEKAGDFGPFTDSEV